MANLREALQKALKDNPTSPLVPVVSQATEKLDANEEDIEKHTEKVRANPIKWMQECNDWYSIGKDYIGSIQRFNGDNRRRTHLIDVKSRAGQMVWGMSFWESTGVIHLLRRFNAGLVSHSMGGIVDYRDFVDKQPEGDHPTGSPNVRRFVQSFEELIGESNNSLGDYIHQKLTPQQRAINARLPVEKVLPAAAEWVTSKYPQAK